MSKQKYIEAGRVTNTHGVRGEIKIEVWLDSPAFLRKCGRIFIDGISYDITGSKLQQRFLIAALNGIENVEAAASLKGRNVYIDRDDAPLGAGEFFFADLIGAKVVDIDGKYIGILEEFYESPANLIYIVRGETEHLIPAVPEFIVSTDADAGIVTVRLIEGM